MSIFFFYMSLQSKFDDLKTRLDRLRHTTERQQRLEELTAREESPP